MAIIASTAALVNTVNDLAAAAITAELLAEVLRNDGGQGSTVAQCVLIALNTGAYITPVGALAGVIWMHAMSTESEMETPSKAETTGFALVHFGLTSIVLAAVVTYV